MIAPGSDEFCRFVDYEKGKWREDDISKPAASAFRASNRILSIWHKDRIEQSGSSLSELCIENLSGNGELLLTPDKCKAFDMSTPGFDELSPEVYWRPEGAGPAWEKWKEAHADLETKSGNKGFPKMFRHYLAKISRVAKYPKNHPSADD